MIPGVTGAKSALAVTRKATAGEKSVIFCDEELKPIGEAFANAALELGLWTKLVILRGAIISVRTLNPTYENRLHYYHPTSM